MRRKKHRPAGAEFEGKCRQLESVADSRGVGFSEIRMADYVFFNGQQWTIRSSFEVFDGKEWVELDWNPQTHSIVVGRAENRATT